MKNRGWTMKSAPHPPREILPVRKSRFECNFPVGVNRTYFHGDYMRRGSKLGHFCLREKAQNRKKRFCELAV
jgi:hypothetical protein